MERVVGVYEYPSSVLRAVCCAPRLYSGAGHTGRDKFSNAGVQNSVQAREVGTGSGSGTFGCPVANSWCWWNTAASAVVGLAAGGSSLEHGPPGL